jgi:hypothetical protein
VFVACAAQMSLTLRNFQHLFKLVVSLKSLTFEYYLFFRRTCCGAEVFVVYAAQMSLTLRNFQHLFKLVVSLKSLTFEYYLFFIRTVVEQKCLLCMLRKCL